MRICVGAGGGIHKYDWYKYNEENAGMEGSVSTFSYNTDTVTTVGGGGGGQGLETRDWHTGGTGGAYGTGAGAHKKDNCIGNFTRADFTGAIGASGSLPAHNVHLSLIHI